MDHPACLAKSKHNITEKFLLAFLLGLIVLVCEFVTTGLLSVCLRLRAETEERMWKSLSPYTLRIAFGITASKHTSEIMTFLVSVY